MPKLSEADRKLRDDARELASAQRAQAQWQEKLAKATLLQAEASQAWTAALASKQLNLRHLWLVLGLFETEERIQAAGKHASCKSRWFDGIAPRTDGAFRGSGGFAARMAAKASKFLKTSGNGYLYITDLGLALIQHLREQHPELAVTQGPDNIYHSWEVPGLGLVPPLRWRQWKDWS